MNRPITTEVAQPNDLEAFWMPFTANRQFKLAPACWSVPKTCTTAATTGATS